MLFQKGNCPRLLLPFGRHQIYEDDPERAVRAALALQGAAQAANRPVQIGVNTGVAYCPQDNTAPNTGSTGAVMGAVVRVAVQLRSRATSGQLLVGKATHRATRGSFAVTPVVDHTDRRRRSCHQLSRSYPLQSPSQSARY